MSNRPPIEVRALVPERRDDWLDFFEHRAFTDNPRWASCYCHYPHADHAAVPWERRTAAENRAASCRRIDAGRMSGWLAYAGDEVVGWINAGPRTEARGLVDEVDADAARIATVACFVIAPAWRRRGVARALLAAACEGLAARGFEWIEGYPRVDPQARAAAQHLGPLSLYREAGFEPLGPPKDGGVVVRKRLSAAGEVKG